MNEVMNKQKDRNKNFCTSATMLNCTLCSNDGNRSCLSVDTAAIHNQKMNFEKIPDIIGGALN